MGPLTYNFTLDPDRYPATSNMIHKKLIDLRNGIEVVNLIPNIESYINYLDYLMYIRDKWISVGYLDLGMIPLVMGPSFTHNEIKQSILPRIQKSGLDVHQMPSVSFMFSKSINYMTDIWVFRDDAAKFLNTTPDKVRTKDIIYKLYGGAYETDRDK